MVYSSLLMVSGRAQGQAGIKHKKEITSERAESEFDSGAAQGRSVSPAQLTAHRMSHKALEPHHAAKYFNTKRGSVKALIISM